MCDASEAELKAAEQLLTALEDYYDVSDEPLEPIVPGHPVHVAVGNWRLSLPGNRLAAAFSRVRALLWKLSKVDRGKANGVAEDFAESLIRLYPSLADGENGESRIAAGHWFDSPPPPDSRFQFGPLSGQIQQLASWMANGDSRTLMKYNGRGSYYIMKDHGRRFSVWFSSSIKFEEVERRQHSEKGMKLHATARERAEQPVFHKTPLSTR
jgi:hypothetical protein